MTHRDHVKTVPSSWSTHTGKKTRRVPAVATGSRIRCDAGFVPTGPAACVAGEWVNNGHVCSDSCVSPDGAVLASSGYDDSGKVETSLSIASFAVTGWQCRAGYDGSVTATVCSGKSHEYSVSGCTQATCANGVIDVDAAACECGDGFTGGGAWVSGPTYPACV